jgi:hypothetical protein
MAAARLATEGKSLEEIKQFLLGAIQRAGLAITLDTFEYAVRGGRVPKSVGWLGDRINIKPIISMDREGKASIGGKAHGQVKAMRAIADYVAEKCAGAARVHLAIMDADAPEYVKQMEALVQGRFQPVELIHSPLTPLMGAQSGPGMIGLGYYCE